MRQRNALIFRLRQQIEAEHHAAHTAAATLAGRHRAHTVNRHLIRIYALRHELSAMVAPTPTAHLGATRPPCRLRTPARSGAGTPATASLIWKTEQFHTDTPDRALTLTH